jgi:hypothetical protein
MMVHSNDAAALAAANHVALAGVIATAAVAVVAIVVQLVLTRIAVVGSERLRRYNELVDVYSKVGEVLSANTTTMAMAMREILQKPNLITAVFVKRRIAKEIHDFAIASNPRHSLNMLKLHRAGEPVVIAERALFDAFEINIDLSLTNSQARDWLEAHMEDVNETLANYYVVAGDDARMQREAIGFWSIRQRRNIATRR